MNLPAYVIDDEEVIQKSLAKLLEKQQFNVTTFGSAEAFAQTTLAPGPHLLIVDKNLPGISGVELLARHQRAGYAYEAILITGYADLDSAIQCVRLGIRSYLRKPFDYSELVTDIEAAAALLLSKDSHNVRTPNPSLGAQADRLEGEVRATSGSLVTISGMDTLQAALCAETIDLTRLLKETVSSSKGLSRKRRVPIWLEVQDSLRVRAAEPALRNLLMILAEVILTRCDRDHPMLIDAQADGEAVTVHIIGEGITVSMLRQADADPLQRARTLTAELHGKLSLLPYLEDVGVDCRLTLIAA